MLSNQIRAFNERLPYHPMKCEVPPVRMVRPNRTPVICWIWRTQGRSLYGNNIHPE